MDNQAGISPFLLFQVTALIFALGRLLAKTEKRRKTGSTGLAHGEHRHCMLRANFYKIKASCCSGLDRILRPAVACVTMCPIICKIHKCNRFLRLWNYTSLLLSFKIFAKIFLSIFHYLNIFILFQIFVISQHNNMIRYNHSYFTVNKSDAQKE